MLKTNFEDLNYKERLTKARVNLNRKVPFFANLLMKFKFVEDENVPLAAVDVKKNIYYNPTNIASLKEKQIMGLLVHEALHWILLHHSRGKNKNHQVFNIATDSVINYLVKQQNLDLPEGAIQTDYKGEITLNIGMKTIIYNTCNNKGDVRSSEDIYHEIINQIPKGKTGRSGTGNDENGMEDYPEGMTGDNGKEIKPVDKHIYGGDGKEGEIEKEVKQAVSQANMYSKSRGMSPAGMKRLVDDLLEPKINWKAELYQYIQKRTTGISDWRRPHRRSHSIGTYLPRKQSDKVSVIFHIDTSGSMSDNDLKQSLTELQELLRTFKEVKINVLVGDAEIQETFELTQNNKEDILSIVKSLKGGGGTSHKPVFDKVKETENVKILICFTDGYTDFPSDTDLEFDTLWLITERGCDEEHIPFGKVIKIDDEDTN